MRFRRGEGSRQRHVTADRPADLGDETRPERGDESDVHAVGPHTRRDVAERHVPGGQRQLHGSRAVEDERLSSLRQSRVQLTPARAGSEPRSQLVVARVTEGRRLECHVGIDACGGERAANVCTSDEPTAHLIRHDSAQGLEVESGDDEIEIALPAPDGAANAHRAARRPHLELLDGRARAALEQDRRADRGPRVAPVVEAEFA